MSTAPDRAAHIRGARECVIRAAMRVVDDNVDDDWSYLRDAVTALRYAEMEPPSLRERVEADAHGTFACPICGVEKPHHHSQGEIDRLHTRQIYDVWLARVERDATGLRDRVESWLDREGPGARAVKLAWVRFDLTEHPPHQALDYQRASDARAIWSVGAWKPGEDGQAGKVLVELAREAE